MIWIVVMNSRDELKWWTQVLNLSDELKCGNSVLKHDKEGLLDLMCQSGMKK